MIGNDIVDLAQACRESNWRRKGFLAKVFTDSEQQLIQSSSNPDVLVWLLWSMKESAYKVIVRETGQRFFAPQKLACHYANIQTNMAEGSVFYQKTYATKSIITTHYVASVAFPENPDQVFTHEIVTFDRTNYQHQHTRIREKINQHYVTLFPNAGSNIHIRKDKTGTPTLTGSDLSGKTIHKPISLSHHGHYGAFASFY
ncbi:4'-phosphopantetheinyl transferase family protein [Spirosoma validum]|uniref:4-phosphopantetheinyl transferase family protein n=1 Tax=Spirosoma validum TaxID=2771355 RepID=A0A927B4N7_9BACT|nr:4'-phosphopantetheinyl transferase superfamily protein [Spirosoma validum]MBD2755584.1 4-phosphopantetheinyl transferase family protein [Spirosoma validum]